MTAATTLAGARASGCTDDPPLDVMAIDNLPSLLPVESSEDYAGQLLPALLTLDRSGSRRLGPSPGDLLGAHERDLTHDHSLVRHRPFRHPRAPAAH